jgi:hypothetical protein
MRGEQKAEEKRKSMQREGLLNNIFLYSSFLTFFDPTNTADLF